MMYRLSIAAFALVVSLSVSASAGFCADKKAKVTGIGGVFFKSKKDQKKLAEWYEKNLGIHLENWGGAIFRWTDDKAEDRGVTVSNPFC